MTLILPHAQPSETRFLVLRLKTPFLPKNAEL